MLYNVPYPMIMSSYPDCSG